MGPISKNVRFGEDDLLAGVLCQPRRPSREKLAVLFLNNGRTAHIGQGRSSVEQARALAAAGIGSLRFDVAGLGESPFKAGRTEMVAYDAGLVEDVSCAIDFLEAVGYSRFLLVGLCSGAHLAFHAAVADERIGAVFLANLLRFSFSPENIRSILQVSWRSQPHYYRDAFLKVAFWRAVLSGDIAVGQKIISLVRSVTEKAQDFASCVRLSSRQTDRMKIRTAFERLGRRGVDVTLAYADGDASYAELERNMGRHGQRLRRYPSMRKIVLAEADHLFVAGSARARFEAAILRFALNEADQR